MTHSQRGRRRGARLDRRGGVLSAVALVDPPLACVPWFVLEELFELVAAIGFLAAAAARPRG